MSLRDLSRPLVSRTLALVVASLGLTATASADMQVVVREDATGVTFEVSGFLDLTDAVHPPPPDESAALPATDATYESLYLPVGASGQDLKSYSVEALDGLSAPHSDVWDEGADFEAGDRFFLTAGHFIFAGDGGLMITPALPQVRVPADYISGAPLRAVTEYHGDTFASLDLVPGVYRYALPNDVVTVYIGAPYPPPHWLDDDLYACRQDLAASEAYVVSLEGQLDAANAQVASLQAALDAANSQVASLQGQLAAANSALGATEAELGQCRSDLADSSDALATCQDVAADTDEGLAAILQLLSVPFGQRSDPRTSGPYASPAVNAAVDALLDPAGKNFGKNE